MIPRDMLKYDCSLTGSDQKDIKGITYDSRKVKEGYLFAAIKGGTTDGHKFIEDAVANGAVAVIYEKEHPGMPGLIARYPAVSWIAVNDCRDALAAFSSCYYGRPSEKMRVIGITGTNGKTTTSYLVKSVLEKWAKGVGLIGTIRYMIRDDSFDAPHTTPESSDFQALLSEMAERKCDYVVSEVSSHALVQKRAGNTQFRIAVFTNLTRDHLDFHGTMDEYFRAKATLFTDLLIDGGTAVINLDDHYGRKLSSLLREQRPSVRQITFALSDKNGGQNADVTVTDIRSSFRGTSFKLAMKGASSGIEFFSPLVGQTSIYNILSAICAVLPLNVPMEVIREGIAALGTVKGRFERVDVGQPFLAVVDYAHTDDALERLLMTSRQLRDDCHSAGTTGGAAMLGKIITVFGCGGNRDRGKRPNMGRIASELSDFVIVTSDNPRYEESAVIIKDIEAGIMKGNYIVIPDRRIAIRMAALLASPGDIVVVAGKGHEDYQDIGGARHPFNDRNVLEDAIRESAAVAARARSRKQFTGAAQCLS